MFIVHISPLAWDFIIIGILVGGFILGILVGLRALIFVTIGNLIGIGLAFAFKSLILPKLINSISNQSSDPVKSLIFGNIAPTIYFAIWVFGMNLLFWIVYIILKFTILKKFKIKHKVVNRACGAILNIFRTGVLAGLVILLAGSGVFATKETLPNFYINEVTSKSGTYKLFSKIYSHYPLFVVSSDDINTINDLRNYIATIDYTTSKITNAKAVDELKFYTDVFNLYHPFTSDQKNAITNLISEATTASEIRFNQIKLNIAQILKECITADFLSASFMQPIFNMVKDLVNLHSNIADYLLNNFNLNNISIDVGSGDNKTIFNNNILLGLNQLINAIQNADAKMKVNELFHKIYQGWN